ncbi:MAG: IS5 family transposase [Methylococcaceae bacterium]
MSFSTILLSQRKLKSEFFNQVNTAIDWNKVEGVLNRYYKKGVSVDGRPAYGSLILFKMCLLQYWYGLSDYEVEAQCNDSISFSNFIGIALEDQIPDHSVISRFRNTVTEKGGWEIIFREVNTQLEAHSIIVKAGVIVDASVTATPLKPKGKKIYGIVEDRKEEQDQTSTAPAVQSTKESDVKPMEFQQSGSHDKEAAWLKKSGKLHFGYKKHVGTDPEGMILSVITTPANESDVVHLIDVVEKASMPAGAFVEADKGYHSQSNKTGLALLKLRSHLMYKAVKGKKLTVRQVSFNKAVSKTRYKIERTFGSMKRWAGAGIARYRGLAKTHTQHLLEAMAHNLYRMPGLAVKATERKRSLMG